MAVLSNKPVFVLLVLAAVLAGSIGLIVTGDEVVQSVGVALGSLSMMLLWYRGVGALVRQLPESFQYAVDVALSLATSIGVFSIGWWAVDRDGVWSGFWVLAAAWSAIATGIALASDTRPKEA